jgi:hypothetical protein
MSDFRSASPSRGISGSRPVFRRVCPILGARFVTIVGRGGAILRPFVNAEVRIVDTK